MISIQADLPVPFPFDTHGVLLHVGTTRVPIVARTEAYAPRLLAEPVSLGRVPATLLSLAGLPPEVNAGAAPPLCRNGGGSRGAYQ